MLFRPGRTRGASTEPSSRLVPAETEPGSSSRASYQRPTPSPAALGLAKSLKLTRPGGLGYHVSSCQGRAPGPGGRGPLRLRLALSLSR